MNDTLLLWISAAIALATIGLLAGVAVRRARRVAARRVQAEQAALRLAQEQTARAAAERAAAQQAAAEAEARLRTELAQRRQAEQQAAVEAARASEAAQRQADAETLAALEEAYREGARRAAEQEARQVAALVAQKAAQELAQKAQAAQDAAHAAAAANAAAAADAAAPPAAAAPFQSAPPTPPAQPAAVRPAAPPLVVVADDSKVVRVKTSRLLLQHGYRVVLAEDGQQAADRIDDEVPLALVTDVEMPGMDGFELTRHVRQHAQARHIPVFMVTSADTRLQAQAAAAGVTRVLGKPYDESALLALLADAREAAAARAGDDLAAIAVGQAAH